MMFLVWKLIIGSHATSDAIATSYGNPPNTKRVWEVIHTQIRFCHVSQPKPKSPWKQYKWTRDLSTLALLHDCNSYVPDRLYGMDWTSQSNGVAFPFAVTSMICCWNIKRKQYKTWSRVWCLGIDEFRNGALVIQVPLIERRSEDLEWPKVSFAAENLSLPIKR